MVFVHSLCNVCVAVVCVHGVSVWCVCTCGMVRMTCMCGVVYGVSVVYMW